MILRQSIYTISTQTKCPVFISGAFFFLYFIDNYYFLVEIILRMWYIIDRDPIQGGSIDGFDY